VLADGAGYPLYIYQPDEQGPSRCTLACAGEWPPLMLPHGVTHPKAGPGVHASLLGTTRRNNGSLQVTYNRWPLYTYRNDTPEKVTGQGAAMGAWYLISANGSVDRRVVMSG
jgi:predicted lipoprotein with Yx(FWY)xxD motif